MKLQAELLLEVGPGDTLVGLGQGGACRLDVVPVLEGLEQRQVINRDHCRHVLAVTMQNPPISPPCHIIQNLCQSLPCFAGGNPVHSILLELEAWYNLYIMYIIVNPEFPQPRDQLNSPWDNAL